MQSLYSQFVVNTGSVRSRHGVNSIPELELRNFELELKFPTEELNPEINLPFLQR